MPALTLQPHALRKAVSGAYSVMCLVVAARWLAAGMIMPGLVVLGGVMLHRAAVRLQR